MSAPDSILQLVDNFETHRRAYLSQDYNEAQVRREFVDPFFEALGWDMFNKGNYAAAYKDVIHEDAIQMGGATKAPDYAFRIGGTRKFFVEAKKPAVNLKDAISPAYQLRRYAWSAKLPLSILTDFEEFTVYDCRLKPTLADKPSTGRIQLLTYRDYPDQWDEIYDVFSRQAVLKGSFDQYAESVTGKHGTAEVDHAFLAEIERWRDLLAHNIALRNPSLSQRDLNYAVQMTIDRLIFLRICEDRGIEFYGQLQALLNGGDVYPRLCQLFRNADDRYNSGLFHFRAEKGQADTPDALSLGLALDDKPLKDILGNLYYPESPYEFSVLPIEILGQVYEQFLGKVIRLTSAHHAVVEDKPEVKKAGGVYYTPTFIVDYIVKHTLESLLENRHPGEVGLGKGAPIRVLDMACGSGSFLLGAYQYLLDWYLNAYTASKPEKWTKGREPQLVQVSHGDWRLTTTERKRILLDHIYGVDIDPQAVEVTKLSLLLKVLEGESQDTVGKQLTMFHQRALPDLGQNIKCGNSLIGPDFYTSQQSTYLEAEEQNRINAFDWQREFAHVFSSSGGFDVIIGNPPWISLSGKFGAEIYSKTEIDYLIKTYKGNTYMPNMYEYFIVKGMYLTKRDGFLGFIVPDRLGFNSQFIELRKKILTENRILSLLYKVPFPGITADTLVFIFQKGLAEKNHLIAISEYGKLIILHAQEELIAHPAHTFEYFDNPESMKLISKIGSLSNLVPLISFCDTTSGFGGKSHLIQEVKTGESQIQTLKGDSIGRYELRKVYWFDFKKQNITGRTTDKTKLGASPKVLLRKTGDHIIATYDETCIYPEQSLYFLYNFAVNVNPKYLLGILNSSFLTYYYRVKSLTNKKSIAQVKKIDLDLLPIPVLNLLDPTEVQCHDHMIAHVERMLSLHQQLANAKTPTETTMLQRQIASTDDQIDALVYELYGLTKEEIRLVEGR